VTAHGAARLVLAIGFVVLFFNSGSRFAIGLLLKPMTDDLGWDRATLSAAVGVFMVITAAALPFVGRLVDRLDLRNLLCGATLVGGLGVGLMSLVNDPVEAIALYGIVFAIGCAGTSITPIGVMISRYFPDRLGLANSVAISGMGIGQLLIIATLSSQLTAVGWRGAFVVLGSAWVLVMLPAVWWALGRAPAATPGHRAGGRAMTPPAGADQLSLGEICRSRRFWMLLGIYGICGFQDFFVATHVVAFALDQRMAAPLAGNMLALMGLFGLAGVLAAGVWTDRSGPVPPTIACFALRAVVFPMILLTQSVAAILIFALAYGATFWVTAPLTVVFARVGFGTALLGTVSGLITMVHHAAGGLGALSGAAIFDRTGDYDAAFAANALLSLLALWITLTLRSSASAA
jgi:predicted MFS family arabinose efflux permease